MATTTRTKHWEVTSLTLTFDRTFPFAVEGHNHFTGETFSWRVPNLDGEEYDLSARQVAATVEISKFDRATRDRAREWLNGRLSAAADEAEDCGEDWADLSDAEFAEELLSVCQELAAIDEVNDRADRLAGAL
jgi:hypothetical protein